MNEPGLSWVSIVAIMLVAGLVGGTINFALSRTEHSTLADWSWAVVVGSGASFLMPLFLETLSSDLLSNLLSSQGGPADVFVFAGFCLLGAIASRAMIQTLSEKILREAEATRAEIEQLETAVTPILDRETEPDDDDIVTGELAGSDLSDSQTEVLSSLRHDRFTLRSVSGVAGDVGLSKEASLKELWSLANLDLAAQVQGKKGKRWILTPQGRARVGDA